MKLKCNNSYKEEAMAKIHQLKDLVPQYAEELAFLGIHSIDDFLRWVSQKGVLEMEKQTHIDHHRIQNWVRQLKKSA